MLSHLTNAKGRYGGGGVDENAGQGRYDLSDSPHNPCRNFERKNRMSAVYYQYTTQTEVDKGYVRHEKLGILMETVCKSMRNYCRPTFYN